MKTIPYDVYRKKLVGCFMGKVIGGTVGMPFEGSRKTRDITFYDPVPTEMVANDDLDLQVVWLECIRKNGLPINRKHLSEAWVEHVHYAFDEYGMALRNIKMGVCPPLSGFLNNQFYSGMGSAIRTELWAVLCPANPDLAVNFACEDACVDHVDDGLHASAFLAAVESAAFTDSDARKLLEIGLSYLPINSRLANGIRDTVSWWDETGDLFAVRRLILDRYEVVNWTDVTINLSFIVLAWLAGGNDFGKCICTAANLGFDTDCTAGTLGSIMGIINPDGIEEKWVEPIGNQLVLSDAIIGIHDISTIEAMCDKMVSLCMDIQSFYKTGISISDAPCFYEPVPHWTEQADAVDHSSVFNRYESLVSVSPFMIRLIYPKGISLIPEQPESFTAVIQNSKKALVQADITLAVPDGWFVEPKHFHLDLPSGKSGEITFRVSAPNSCYNPNINELKLFFQTDTVDFQIHAGLIQALPWLRQAISNQPERCPGDKDFACAETVYANSFVQSVPRGKYIWAVEFKLHADLYINLVAQALPLTLWIDGEKAMEHDGYFYTPSAHRFEDSVQMNLKAGWHRAVIFADNEQSDPAGQLFFAVGNMAGKTWIDQIEWRKPVLKPIS